MILEAVARRKTEIEDDKRVQDSIAHCLYEYHRQRAEHEQRHKNRMDIARQHFRYDAQQEIILRAYFDLNRLQPR